MRKSLTLGCFGLLLWAIWPPASVSGQERELLFLGGVMAPERAPQPFATPATLPGAEPRIATIRRNLGNAAQNVADANFDVWLLDGLTSLGELRRLEGMLRLEVEAVAEACGLSADQKTKLRLAGEQDVRRYIESIETLRKGPRRLAPPEREKLIDRLLAAKANHEYDLLDEQSFFQKVLTKSLDEEQIRRYERFDVARRRPPFEAQVVEVIRELNELLEVRNEQRRELARILSEQLRLPRKSGPYDRDVILLQIANLPEALALFDADQQDISTDFFARFRQEEEILKTMGLLSETPAHVRPQVLAAIGAKSEPAPPAAITPPPSDTLEALALLLEKTNRQEVERRAKPRPGWGPEQVEGRPDTPGAGDIATAWASQTTDGQPEWLICRYAEAVELKAIEIHESFNPGAVVKVSAFNAANDEIKVWDGVDPTARGEPRGVSVIPVQIGFKTKKIKVYIDSPAVPGYNEIDAVGLRDVGNDIHWAQKVIASSSFANLFPMQQQMPMRVISRQPHGPEQVIGPPNTRAAGDTWTAWASQNPDDQEEWLICRYDAPRDVRGVIIHETFNPGALTRVSVFDASDKEVVAWEGADPTPRTERMGISVIPIRVPFQVTSVKLHIDSPAVPGFNEIDAVAVRDAAGQTHWAQQVEASSTFGMGQARPVLPAVDAQRIRRLEAQLQELRDELTRLKGLEAQVEELRRELKAPNKP